MKTIVVIAILFAQYAQAVQYQLIDLGTGGWPHSVATSINNNGQVVGYSTTSEDYDYGRAFIYSNGVRQDLGITGNSRAYSINDSGQIVGGYTTSSKEYGVAFLYTSGVMQTLGTFDGNPSCAYSINESGQISGGAGVFSHTVGSAFLYQNNTLQPIGEKSGWNLARGINNHGDTVVMSNSTGHVRSYIYSNGTMQDIGTLGGTYAGVMAINEKGQVVGNSTTSGGASHAFLYSSGTTIDLGLGVGNWGSYGLGINNQGDVVGTTLINNGGIQHSAFIYMDGQQVDLNDCIDPTLGWYLEEAWDINDNRQIVGYGNGGRAFMLIPAIPEPSTFLLLPFGFVLFLRRKHN